MIKRSIDTVILRRRNRKGRPVDSFLNFSHEVKKNIAIRHDLMTNAGIREEPPSELNKIKEFFEKYPEEIREFEKDFRDLSGLADGERRKKIEKIYDLLASRFRDEEDLNIKMKLFMGNLPDSMKNENIADKFRRNYLKGRFRIPDFDND